MVVDNGVQVSIQLGQISQDGLRITNESAVVVLAYTINGLKESVFGIGMGRDDILPRIRAIKRAS